MIKTSLTTIYPVDTGAICLNPGMGLTLTLFPRGVDNGRFWTDPSDIATASPLVSTVCFRVPWSFLEPVEGRFNWPLLDTPAQRWIARGKRIVIRVTCSEGWLPYATPEWVKDAGATGWNYRYGRGRNAKGHSWDPDPSDPVFLEKLEAFLRVFALRYDGNPNVAFIEIGSLGLSGQCHTANSSRIPDKLLGAAVRAHIALHTEAFQRTPLVIGAGVARAGLDEGEGAGLAQARSRGVLIRDDGLVSGESSLRWQRALRMGDEWITSPQFLGDPHDGMPSKREDDDLGEYLEAITGSRTSYASLPLVSTESLEQNRDAILQIARTVGYRFQLRRATWPSVVAIGDPFEIETRWENAGAAPCYSHGFVAFTLKDHRGGIAAVLVDESFDVGSLIPKGIFHGYKRGAHGDGQTTELQPVYPMDGIAQPDCNSSNEPSGLEISTEAGLLRSRCVVGENDPLIPSCLYDLYVSIGQCDGTPAIALPLPDDDGNLRYRLGKMRLQSPY
jgi:hypothetical protein